MAGWTAADIPDQSGRTLLVTGATDGLGYQTALALAGKGARVILAARDPARGEASLARIRAAHPLADLAFEQVDMGELASVRALAERVGDTPLDGLVNNAGIRWEGPRRASPQGSSCTWRSTISATSPSPACCSARCGAARPRGWSACPA